jgi:hypothetical protein
MARSTKIGFMIGALICGFILSSLCGCAACRKIEIRYKSVSVALDLDKRIE